MKTTKIKVILAIIACLIVVILSLVQGYSIERLAYTMLIVVIMFYIFGSIIQVIVNKILKNNEHKDNEKSIDQVITVESNEPIIENVKNKEVNIINQINNNIDIEVEE